MLSLLSEDILRVLSEFLQPLDLFQTSKIGHKILEWRFPFSVRLRNIHQIRQFEHWCQIYDTSRLIEVIMITELFDNEDEEIGWVPPSVKTLHISNNAGCRLIIPDGVENISIGRCKLYNIILPDSVRFLTLKTNFNGSVRIPNNLYSFTVKNWSFEDPNQDLDQYITIYHNLPNSIHQIYIGSEIPLTFSEWPHNLAKLTIEKQVNIVNIEYPSVPDTIDYTEIWDY